MIIGKIIMVWSVTKVHSHQLGGKPYEMPHAGSNIVTNVSIYKTFPFNNCLVSHIFSYKPWKAVLAPCDTFHPRDLCPAYWSVKLCISNQPRSVWPLSWMCTLSLLLMVEFGSLWTGAVRFMPNSSFAFRPMWGCKWDVTASLTCFRVPCKRCSFSSRGRGHNKLNATIIFFLPSAFLWHSTEFDWHAINFMLFKRNSCSISSASK